MNRRGYGFPALMVKICFDDRCVWRDCCDSRHMARKWGAARSRLISHRLQQLEAMASILDLTFLPLDARNVGSKIEVSVDDELVLLLDPKPDPGPSGDDEATITVVVKSVDLPAQKVTR